MMAMASRILCARRRVLVRNPLGRQPHILPLELLFGSQERDQGVALLDSHLDFLGQTLAAQYLASDRHQPVTAHHALDISNQLLIRWPE